VTEPDHYFSRQPSAPSAPRTVRLGLPERTLRLTTDAAVFSADRVDPGTELLLTHGPDVPAEGDLLDLGCGYGAIAITLALRAPGATVWAVDVNERALSLCDANARAHGLTNVRAVGPDQVPADVRFVAVWSNPPIRVGKAALHELLLRWLDRLVPSGTAHLVVSKHLGADSLARWLAGQGFTVHRRASRRGYRLLDIARAVAAPADPPPAF
jgi:16S rRNA (guanine1207-N2)-methyltransferase